MDIEYYNFSLDLIQNTLHILCYSMCLGKCNIRIGEMDGHSVCMQYLYSCIGIAQDDT